MFFGVRLYFSFATIWSNFRLVTEKLINTAKTIGNRKRHCVCGGDKHYLRKSADRKAQTSSVSGIYQPPFSCTSFSPVVSYRSILIDITTRSKFQLWSEMQQKNQATFTILNRGTHFCLLSHQPTNIHPHRFEKATENASILSPIVSTAWCSELGSLTPLDASELQASSDVREPISLHLFCMTSL